MIVIRFIRACLVLLVLCLLASVSHAEEASLTYTITNKGQPVPKAWFAVYEPGERDVHIDYADSGKPLHVEAGTYDIGIHFEDGAVNIVKWIENKAVSGGMRESFDLGVPVTELCITITNNGANVKDKGWFAIHTSKEDVHLHYEGSGSCFLVTSGVYQVALHYEDGDLNVVKWLDDQKVEGKKFEKSIELSKGVAQPKYTITNNGQDLGKKACWEVYPVGERNSYLAYKSSGESMTIEAGMYDVHIEYNDGDLKKEKWLEKEKFEGSTNKTIELDEGVAQAKVTVTNNGVDVGPKAWWAVYKPGARNEILAYKNSGEVMTINAGTYDIGIDFTDGDAHEERWLENQVVGKDYQKTVELGLPIAAVKIQVTNNGVDVGRKAWWALYERGERSNHLAYKNNGENMIIPEGDYDLGVHFEDRDVGFTHWVPNFAVKGRVEKTVELSAGLADVTVRVSRSGAPLPKAWCGVYKTKESSSYEAYAYSEKPMRVLLGTYDIGCFYAENGITVEKWLERKVVKADTNFDVELDLQPATLTIRSNAAGSGNRKPGVGAEGSGDVRISVILDASGSMAAKVEEKKTRLDVAKEVLSDVIDHLPKDVKVELQAYGTAPKVKADCRDTKVLAPLGTVDAEVLKGAISTLKPSGFTPIAYSLEKAASSLPKGRNNSLILITDGIESCNGDPCAVSSRLSAEGLVTRSFVVGFGLDLDKGKFLCCIGKYYPASDRKALQAALKEAVSESLKPMTGHLALYRHGDRKEIVAQGSLDEALAVPAGAYDVLIQAGNKSYTWANARIEGKIEKLLSEVPGVK